MFTSADKVHIVTHLCKRYWDTCLPFSRKHTLMDSVSCPLPPYSQQLSITLSQWQKDKQLQGSFAKVRRHYPHHFCITKSPYLTGAAIMLLRVLCNLCGEFLFCILFFLSARSNIDALSIIIPISASRTRRRLDRVDIDIRPSVTDPTSRSNQAWTVARAIATTRFR